MYQPINALTIVIEERLEVFVAKKTIFSFFRFFSPSKAHDFYPASKSSVNCDAMSMVVARLR